jgi:hypothetical protein
LGNYDLKVIGKTAFNAEFLTVANTLLGMASHFQLEVSFQLFLVQWDKPALVNKLEAFFSSYATEVKFYDKVLRQVVCLIYTVQLKL